MATHSLWRGHKKQVALRARNCPYYWIYWKRAGRLPAKRHQTNIKKKHTFYNREHTNKHLIEEATKVAYPNKPYKQVKLFSDYHKDKKIRLLGHVIRANQSDPLRQVSFMPGTINPLPTEGKRAGHPKQDWLFETKRLVWHKILEHPLTEPFTDNHEQCQDIFWSAKNYVF